MLEFNFSNSQKINRLNLENKLIPNDIIKLGVVMNQDKYNCLAKITEVKAETFRFKLINNCNIPLYSGQEFEIIFMQQTGVYKILVQLEEIVMEEPELVLEVRNKGQTYKIQNRNYFRLNIYKRVNFTKITNLDDKIKSEEYKGVIENISAAGIKLITNCPLVENDHLNLDFKFAELSFDNVIAKVTRVEKKAAAFKEAEYYEAGVEFGWEDLSEQDELANWLNQQTHKYL